MKTHHASTIRRLWWRLTNGYRAWRCSRGEPPVLEMERMTYAALYPDRMGHRRTWPVGWSR